MRMLLSAVIDTEAGNEAVRNGTIGDMTNRMIESLKPEAVYFVGQDGQRSCLVVFDLKDPSQIPVVCEPLFQGANAKITLTPCMSLEDVQRGLAELAQQSTPQG
jgi:hypothetical protein